MKRTIVITLMLAATFCNSYAGNKPGNDNGNSKTIWYQMPVSQIDVKHDIDLVLVQGAEKALTIEGDASNDVKWSIKNGTLCISSGKGSLKGKAKVTVTVSLLKELNIIGDSHVKTATPLLSSFLDVYIDGSATVALTSVGKIEIRHDDFTVLEVRHASNDVLVWK